MAFSPSTGVLQGHATLPTVVQRQVAEHRRKMLAKQNDTSLATILKDLNDVKRKLAMSNDPFHADIHRRLDRIKRRLSGKKAVMFAP